LNYRLPMSMKDLNTYIFCFSIVTKSVINHLLQLKYSLISFLYIMFNDIYRLQQTNDSSVPQSVIIKIYFSQNKNKKMYNKIYQIE
jgi:hypothetical protein